jgi:ribonuclease Z
MGQIHGVTVHALSVGGLETCLTLPGFDLAIDQGRAQPGAVFCGTVLFTHAHIDHMGAAASHCATRSLMGLPPPRYAVPAEDAAAFEALLDAWRRLDRSPLDCTVLPASPGTTVDLGRGRSARAFRSLHRVPCLGWSLWEPRKRLAPAWAGAPPAELQAARRRGEAVDLVVERPVFAYTGDTLIEVVEREAVVREAAVLFLECTFLDDRVSVASARDKGHIHLDEVIARADLFANEALVFCHLSARYRTEEAAALLAARLPPSLRARAWVQPNDRAGSPAVPVDGGP